MGLRIRLLAVLSLTLLAATTACGSSAPIRGAGLSGTLTIWYSTDDPVEHVWSQGLAQLFQKSHPSVSVKLSTYEFEDINQKMQLAFSSNTPPDLAYVTPRTCGIPVYVQNHELMNLTADAHRLGWAQLLRRGLLQDYNSPFGLYATQKRGLPGAKVPIYAVPDAVAAVAVMYNTQIMNRLRLGVPKTVSAFSAQLAKAKSAGYTPIALGNADGWLGDDWYQTLVNTKYPYDQLEQELRLYPSFRFNRSPFVGMAGLLQSWANSGYFTPNFGGLDAQDGVDAFFRGKTLFELISSSENSQILGDEKQTKTPIGVFPFPASGSAGVMPQSGYEGWIVPKGSANKPAAMAFINWLLKPAATHFLIDHGVLPAINVSPSRAADPWQRAYLTDLQTSRPGVYLDAAPVPNLNATMEANVQLLMQTIEAPTFLPKAMQQVYSSHGSKHTAIQPIDCEF